VQRAATLEIAESDEARRRETLGRLEQRATLLGDGGSQQPDDRNGTWIGGARGVPTVWGQSFCDERGARASSHAARQSYQPDGGIDATTGGNGFAGHRHSLRPDRADRRAVRRSLVCTEA